MDRHIDRRGFLALTGATSLAAFLAACGGSSSEDSGGGSSDTAAAGGGEMSAPQAVAYDPAGEPDGAMEVFTWAGYDDSEEAGAPWMWSQYQEGEYGEKSPLKFTFLEDDTQALSKVASGYSPDIIHPCAMWIQQWKEGGLIKPLDTSLLPDFEGIPEPIRAGGNIDGQEWFVPFDVGFSSMTYDADVIDFEDGESWSMLLDPRLKGKMSFFADPTAIIMFSHLINEPTDPMVLTTEQIQAAKETALRWKPNARSYWSSQTDAVNDFANGNLVATYTWPDGYWRIKNHPKMKGRNIKYLAPKEGRGAWVCGMVLGATTKQPGRASLAMASANTPQAGAALTDYFQYASAQKDGVEGLIQDKELVKAFSIDDPAAWEPPNAWWEKPLPNYREYIAAGEEVKAA